MKKVRVRVIAPENNVRYTVSVDDTTEKTESGLISMAIDRLKKHGFLSIKYIRIEATVEGAR